MSLPYMPFYGADYLNDTGHLRTIEHGAYLLLIIQYWANGGLPNDERKLARIARLSATEWEEARETLTDLFGDGWRHKRIDIELAHAADVVSKRRAAAEVMHSKRRANAMHMHSESSANAEQMQSTCGDNQIHIESKIERKKVSKRLASLACAIDPQFEEFWKAYPRRGGANPKPEARIAFQKALDRGVDAQTIIAGAIRYGEFVRAEGQEHSRFIPMQATWLNDQGWENEYIPERNHQNGQDKSAVAAARRLHERVREWSGETDGEIRPVLAITGK